VVKAFSDENLEITFTCNKDLIDTTAITTSFSNKSNAEITDVNFQAAVLKHLKLTMNNISGTKIPPSTNNGLTQTMKVQNSMQGQKGIVLKLKVVYTVRGAKVDRDVVVKDFPETY